jgi:hypothetical protein
MRPVRAFTGSRVHAFTRSSSPWLDTVESGLYLSVHDESHLTMGNVAKPERVNPRTRERANG